MPPGLRPAGNGSAPQWSLELLLEATAGASNSHRSLQHALPFRDGWCGYLREEYISLGLTKGAVKHVCEHDKQR